LANQFLKAKLRNQHKILKDSAELFVHCVCLYGTTADQIRTGRRFPGGDVGYRMAKRFQIEFVH
jgi:hypothetical protein